MQEGQGFEELAGEGADQGEREPCRVGLELTSVGVVFNHVKQAFAQYFKHDNIVFVFVMFEGEVVDHMDTA